MNAAWGSCGFGYDLEYSADCCFVVGLPPWTLGRALYEPLVPTTALTLNIGRLDLRRAAEAANEPNAESHNSGAQCLA